MRVSTIDDTCTQIERMHSDFPNGQSAEELDTATDTLSRITTVLLEKMQATTSLRPLQLSHIVKAYRSIRTMYTQCNLLLVSEVTDVPEEIDESASQGVCKRIQEKLETIDYQSTEIHSLYKNAYDAIVAEQQQFTSWLQEAVEEYAAARASGEI